MSIVLFSKGLHLRTCLDNGPFTRWYHLLLRPESIRVFLSCANYGFCPLNLAGITKFKYDKKNEKDCGRSSKMTPSCNWPILSPIVVMTVNALFLCRWLIRLLQSRYLVSQLIFHKSGPELFLTMVRTAATKIELCLYIFINCFAGIPYMNSPVVSCSCSRAITYATCFIKANTTRLTFVLYISQTH